MSKYLKFISSYRSINTSEPPLNTSSLYDFINYLIGFSLSSLLTCAAFLIAQSDLIWRPGIPVALTALAIAQIGIQLVFFLHLTTGSDNINNSIALAFGTLVVTLVIAGTLWIMSSMSHHTSVTIFRNKSAHNHHESSLHLEDSSIFKIFPSQAQVGKKIKNVFCVVGQHVEINQECALIDIHEETSRENLIRKQKIS